MASTVAEITVATLKASGVKRVYGLPGDSLGGRAAPPSNAPRPAWSLPTVRENSLSPTTSRTSATPPARRETEPRLRSLSSHPPPEPGTQARPRGNLTSVPSEPWSAWLRSRKRLVDSSANTRPDCRCGNIFNHYLSLRIMECNSVGQGAKVWETWHESDLVVYIPTGAPGRLPPTTARTVSEGHESESASA
jgi:hypothetical protein